MLSGSADAIHGLGRSMACMWRCGSLEFPELPHSATTCPAATTLAPPHPQRAAAEVGERDAGAVVAVDDEVVAEDARRTGQLADALGHQVEEAGWRGAAPVVTPARPGPHHLAGDRRSHRLPGPGESFGRRASGDQDTPGRDPSADRRPGRPRRSGPRRG